MYRSATHTACLLAVLLNRSGQKRARVSAKTIKILAGRTNLRSAFVVELIAALADEYGWILSELEIGGYGAILAKTLEAAKPVTAKRWLTEDERMELRHGPIDFISFEKEAAVEQDRLDDED